MSTTPTPLIFAGRKATPAPKTTAETPRRERTRGKLENYPFADLGRMLAMAHHPAGKGRS